MAWSRRCRNWTGVDDRSRGGVGLDHTACIARCPSFEEIASGANSAGLDGRGVLVRQRQGRQSGDDGVQTLSSSIPTNFGYRRKYQAEVIVYPKGQVAQEGLVPRLTQGPSR